MGLWQLAYNTVGLAVIRTAARLAAPFNPKLAASLAGRKRSFCAIEDFLSALPGGRACPGGIWFHASSVGEFLQAVPLMRRIKKDQGQRPIYLSFSSPSVEKAAGSFEAADIAFYLPEDTASNMRRLLRMLEPALVIFSKFDIWPNLVRLACEVGVPVAVTAATLSPGSGRLRGLAACFHRSFYRHLSLVCAISDQDAESYRSLGVEPENCLVTGDTRFDQTFERAAGIEATDPRVAAFANWSSQVCLVCGSIWPADEEHLLPAIARLAGNHQSLRFILVPHELAESHLESLAAFLDKNRIEYEFYSSFAPEQSEDRGESQAGPKESARAVIVDRMGVLAAVYRTGDIAYVGGSFSTGVHNVMEPACFGLPVVFGPRHLNSYEARLMIERRGAFPVRDSESLYRTVELLAGDDNARKEHGSTAHAVVTENLGATERTLEALAEYFPGIINPSRR